MNRSVILLIVLFFVNNCSFNENARIWKDKDQKLSTQSKLKKVFVEDKIEVQEFNQGLFLDLSLIKINKKFIDNQNNFGSQIYNGGLDKIGSYKFSRLEELNQINYKPLFLMNSIVFFDKKGSIIKYDDNQKVIWKKTIIPKQRKNYILS